MTLSESQASRRPDGDVRSPAGPGLPLLTRITFSTCRAPYPGGSMAGTSRWICAAPRAGFSQHRSGLPGPNYRSASTLNFSRFAQASLTLRPVDLLTHHCGLGRKASTPPVPRRRRFSATQAYRYPPEVGLSPTGVPRCKSAHWLCLAKLANRRLKACATELGSFRNIRNSCQKKAGCAACMEARSGQRVP